MKRRFPLTIAAGLISSAAVATPIELESGKIDLHGRNHHRW